MAVVVIVEKKGGLSDKYVVVKVLDSEYPNRCLSLRTMITVFGLLTGIDHIDRLLVRCWAKRPINVDYCTHMLTIDPSD